MMNRIAEWLENRYGYLRFRTNWHKHPVVSRLLCSIGRHDYEYEGPGNHPNSAILWCFYCDAKRNSTISQNG